MSNRKRSLVNGGDCNRPAKYSTFDETRKTDDADSVGRTDTSPDAKHYIRFVNAKYKEINKTLKGGDVENFTAEELVQCFPDVQARLISRLKANEEYKKRYESYSNCKLEDAKFDYNNGLVHTKLAEVNEYYEHHYKRWQEGRDQDPNRDYIDVLEQKIFEFIRQVEATPPNDMSGEELQSCNPFVLRYIPMYMRYYNPTKSGNRMGAMSRAIPCCSSTLGITTSGAKARTFDHGELTTASDADDMSNFSNVSRIGLSTRSRQDPFLAGKGKDDVLLKFPFEGDFREIEGAAEELTEAYGQLAHDAHRWCVEMATRDRRRLRFNTVLIRVKDYERLLNTEGLLNDNLIDFWFHW